MALQDLTPQLRTRLSRVERVVGIFVILATLLMLTGFIYYLYHTAKRKGWFITTAPYFTFVRSAAGLKEGDPVRLMGFDVGEIIKIEAMPANMLDYDVYLEFSIRAPYFGYLWTDSRVKPTAGDFLGNRFLEVTRGTKGQATYMVESDPAAEVKESSVITHVWDDGQKTYKPRTKETKPYWLRSEESPPLTERLERVISTVENALPAVFSLTNQIAQTLTNSTRLTARLDASLAEARPAVTNLTALLAQLRGGPGALGDWLIPTNINRQLEGALASADLTLRNTDTNLHLLAANLNGVLENLADLTSNLNAQVQANSLILTEISSLVVDADDFLQGLKRNWLLKSSFAVATNKPMESLVHPSIGAGK
jgi:ABC-type transporter Mla subunit MlaD